MVLDAAYRHCERIVREHAGNFRWSFPFLPPEKKRAIAAVYAFCRRVDDVADGDLPPAEKRARLAAAADSLRAPPGDDPVLAALADARSRFAVPLAPFDDLIAGVRQDLDVDRYSTWADLQRYCDLVASSVGLLCLEIFTYSDSLARDRAFDLGRAMQLSNIVRDVKEDAARGRIYLPREDLDRFGVSEAQVLQGDAAPALRNLLRFETERARALFKRSRELPPYLPRHARSCPIILAKLYGGILDRIERADYDVFDGRVSLSGPRKAWIAFTGLLGSLL
jgi:phytoene synthase